MMLAKKDSFYKKRVENLFFLNSNGISYLNAATNIGKQTDYWVERGENACKATRHLRKVYLNTLIKYLTEDLIPKHKLPKIINDINQLKATSGTRVAVSVDEAYMFG